MSKKIITRATLATTYLYAPTDFENCIFIDIITITTIIISILIFDYVAVLIISLYLL